MARQSDVDMLCHRAIASNCKVAYVAIPFVAVKSGESADSYSGFEIDPPFDHAWGFETAIGGDAILPERKLDPGSVE